MAWWLGGGAFKGEGVKALERIPFELIHTPVITSGKVLHLCNPCGWGFGYNEPARMNKGG